MGDRNSSTFSTGKDLPVTLSKAVSIARGPDKNYWHKVFIRALPHQYVDRNSRTELRFKSFHLSPHSGELCEIQDWAQRALTISARLIYFKLIINLSCPTWGTNEGWIGSGWAVLSRLPIVLPLPLNKMLDWFLNSGHPMTLLLGRRGFCYNESPCMRPRYQQPTT